MMDQVGGKGIDRAVSRVAPPTAATPAVSVIQTPAQPRVTADVATLSGVAAELASKPPVDTDRVREIKHAIANGTFPILPATIADRLLALRYDWMSNEQA